MLTLTDIYAARARMAGLVRRTPLAGSSALSAVAGAEVRLKLECWQETGAFKLRGAVSRIGALTPEERAQGVIAVSTGNHGRAVAFAARRLGIRAVICVSELVPPHKRAAIEALGAEVVVGGASQDEAERFAAGLVASDGLLEISAFDDPMVIAGQGTIGLEIAEDWPEVEACVVPLSGGGLMGGIAVALKAVNPAIRLIGVTMENGPAMHESLRAGRPVDVVEVASLADSLTGGIGLDNRWTFELCRTLVDETVLVSEAEIAAGMRHLLVEERVVAEGGAAVGVAAVLAGKLDLAGRRTAIVVSGQNVEMAKLLKIAGDG